MEDAVELARSRDGQWVRRMKKAAAPQSQAKSFATLGAMASASAFLRQAL
jgi:hypothetical protein